MTESEPLPPAPVQVSVNVAVFASALVVSVPDVPFVPDHPPVAVQDVAFEDDHVSEVVPFTGTLLAAAVRSTVGAGGGVLLTVTVALRVGLLPPVPLHTSV